MFKSKVIEVYDFKKVNVPEKLLRIEVDKSLLNEPLMRLAKKNAIAVEADDEIVNGDQVIVEMKSNIDKYNKKISIVVGMELFDKSFEDELLGLKANDGKGIIVNGSTVDVKIVDVKRKTIPDVTNDMVLKLGIEGVSTVVEFNLHSFNEVVTKIKDEKFYDIYGIVLDKIIEESSFEIEQDEINSLIEDELNRCRAIGKQQNIVFDEMTEEKMSGIIPARTVAEFKEFLIGHEQNQLKSALISMKLSKEDGIKFDESSYKEFIEKEAALNNSDIETVKSINPFHNYIIIEYNMNLFKRVKKYFDTKFIYE